MVKPFLSVILPPARSLRTLTDGLIEIDYRLQGADFSHEIIIPCFDEVLLESLKRFATLIRSARVVDGDSGAASARGSWRLFLTPESPERFELFYRILELAKDGAEMFVGVRASNDGLKNFIVRRLLRTGLRDHFSGFRCFSAGLVSEFSARGKFDWHFGLEPIIFARLKNLTVAELPLPSDHGVAAGDGLWPLVRKIFHLRRQPRRPEIEKNPEKK